MGSDSLHSERHNEKEPKHEVAIVKTAIGDEAYQAAIIKEPPPKIAAPILILASMVAFCCSTANGYDGSLFGTLLSSEDFSNFFAVDNKGIGTGIVTSMYQIGSVVAIPCVGPAIDTWGRRAGMTIGAWIIIVGVIIQIACIKTASVDQFMTGRFFLGFGVSIAAAAGPTYVVEVSHPAHRGIITGLYNVMWPVGALVASSASRGGFNYKGTNTSWMIPVCLQMMFPCVIAFGAMFLPESPRWLYTHGKKEKATATLVKIHGRGNPDSEWVKLQLTEYEEHLEMDGSDKRWWDYRALFRNKASVYRLTCNCLVSLFGQWAGNSIVSYYLSAFLETAGIPKGSKQVDVAMGMNAIQIVFAAVGAALTDIVGRRPMLLVVNLVCALCWVGVTVPASIANITNLDDKSQVNGVTPPVSRAMLAWVYLFQIFYSIGWTPLQALYPVEVLSYEIRAKGMAFSSLFTNAAMLVMQFGIPVALEKIAWKTYIVFCIWCVCQSIILYFLVPETKNRTLEELDHIFSSDSPVKASKQKKVFEADANANIIHVEPAVANPSKV
ncbi:hypothetical protein FGRMN_3874 [Fusarium graminum]|nr:hypothetical protein FGRMN_3874 [Fusarium graminum]